MCPVWALSGARPFARYPLSPAPVAQWTERRPSKPRVGGSNPPRRIAAGSPPRLRRAMMTSRGFSFCRRCRCGERRQSRHSRRLGHRRPRYPELSTVAVAQLVEPLVVVQVVVGSSPISHPRGDCCVPPSEACPFRRRELRGLSFAFLPGFDWESGGRGFDSRLRRSPAEHGGARSWRRCGRWGVGFARGGCLARQARRLGHSVAARAPDGGARREHTRAGRQADAP